MSRFTREGLEYDDDAMPDDVRELLVDIETAPVRDPRAVGCPQKMELPRE